MLSILLLFYFFCSISGQTIKDKFTFCQHNDNNRIVNLNFACKQNPILNKVESKNENLVIQILAKQEYVINDFGYQCYKKRIIRFMNMSVFFAKSEAIRREIIKLSRIECLAMVESRTCDNKKMNCDDNGCIYSEIPFGEYLWNRDIEYSNFECKFHKKHILTDKLNSSLFSNGISSCKPNNLFCQLFDSIVVWQDTSVKRSPFKRIFWGQRFMRKGNLIFFKSKI